MNKNFTAVIALLIFSTLFAAHAKNLSPTQELPLEKINSLTHAQINSYCKARGEIAGNIASGGDILPTFANDALLIRIARFSSKQARQWMYQTCLDKVKKYKEMSKLFSNSPNSTSKEHAKKKRQAEKRQAEAALNKQIQQAEKKKQKENQLEKQLPAEQKARESRQQSNAMQQYVSAIKNKVESHWVQPPGVEKVSCTVRLHQLPSGQLTSKKLVTSCGSTAANQSVLRAITRSSPLPTPSSQDLFQRIIQFNFTQNQ